MCVGKKQKASTKDSSSSSINNVPLKKKQKSTSRDPNTKSSSINEQSSLCVDMDDFNTITSWNIWTSALMGCSGIAGIGENKKEGKKFAILGHFGNFSAYFKQEGPQRKVVKEFNDILKEYQKNGYDISIYIYSSSPHDDKECIPEGINIIVNEYDSNDFDSYTLKIDLNEKHNPISFERAILW